MTNQQVLFESHVLLCKPHYKSAGVDELLNSRIDLSYKLLLS